MATPNYGNQMGPGPGMPMQQHPGMGPPQAAAPPPRPVRRGTSKAVPVVMSAGLAVGVFCGLLFGLGTGNEGAIAATGPRPNLANAYGSDDLPDILKTPTAADGTAKKVDPTAPPTAAAPSAALAPVPSVALGSNGVLPTAVAATATGSAAAVVPAKLKVEISPDSAQAGAKITVDGKDFTPDMVIALDGAAKKTVDVVVHANGFHESDQKIDVTPGDTTVKVELVKRATQPAAGSTPAVARGNGNGGTARPTWTGTQAIPSGTPAKTPSKGNGNGNKSNPNKPPPKGGLIDI